MNKIFFIDEIRELTDSLFDQRISISKLTEILNEKANSKDVKLEGVIIMHKPAPELYGGVAVQTTVGNFGVVKKDQKEAAGRIGEKVIVKQDFDFYKIVEIVSWAE